MIIAKLFALWLLNAEAGEPTVKMQRIAAKEEEFATATTPLQNGAEIRCGDRHPRCFGWANRDGLCTQLIKYMQSECPASCGICDNSSSDPCALKPGGDSVVPGDLKAAFEHAASLRDLEPMLLNEEPRILSFDKFLSAQDTAKIIKVAEGIGFQPSGSGCSGNMKLCNMGYIQCSETLECRSAPEMQRLEQRMRDLLHVPLENCEGMGIFRYGPGHTFRRHHDQPKPVPIGKPGGPRVWAAYIFLSEVDSGGAFVLPSLNLSVMPKAGRALMWPHLLDGDLFTPDERTYHEGAPVQVGVKYAAVLMAHRSDFRTRVLAGCPMEPHIAHNFARDRIASGPLHIAASEGDVDRARRLLADGAQVDQADGGRLGKRPLHEAAIQGRVAMMQLLIAAGAALDGTDAGGESPLHSAVLIGQVDAVELLLRSGASINATGFGGSTALHLASAKGQAACALVLLQFGAPVDVRDSHGGTALHVAAAFGHEEVVQILFDFGAGLHQTIGDAGSTARQMAMAHSHSHVVELLDRLEDALRVPSNHAVLTTVDATGDVGSLAMADTPPRSQSSSSHGSS